MMVVHSKVPCLTSAGISAHADACAAEFSVSDDPANLLCVTAHEVLIVDWNDALSFR
jgi:hypothetical protein